MGKTILASRIVEELRSSVTTQPRTAVVYCYHAEQQYSNVELIIGTILAQLFKGSEERSAGIPDNVRHAFRKTYPPGKQDPTLAELLYWLRETVSVHANESPVIILDGLDELTTCVRAEVLHCLHPSSLFGVKLFITSRFQLDEADVGEDHFGHTSIELSTKKFDVECLISESLRSPRAYQLMNLVKTKSGRKARGKHVIKDITTRSSSSQPICELRQVRRE